MLRHAKPQVLEGGEELRLKSAWRKILTPLASTRGEPKCWIAFNTVELVLGSTIVPTPLQPIRLCVHQSPIGCSSPIGRRHDARGGEGCEEETPQPE